MTEHSEQASGKQPHRPESHRDASAGPSRHESSRPDGAEGVERESASEDTVKLKSREHRGESDQSRNHTRTQQDPRGNEGSGRHSER